MKRQLIILLLLCLGASSLRAQDTTAVRGVVPLRNDTIPSCQRRPVNDYPGLNSLMRRLANPGWNGLMKDIHTGLKLEGGRIRPLGGSLTEADAGISPVTSSGSYAGENAEAAGAPVTSSGSYAGENAEPSSLYLREMELGEVPVGPPVFVFFRLAGSYITDFAQMLSIQAAAELAARENLLVRITGAADSATGSSDKNAALATARAEHIARLFKERGVPEERIEIRSEGGTTTYEPVAANRNCRIELLVDSGPVNHDRP